MRKVVVALVVSLVATTLLFAGSAVAGKNTPAGKTSATLIVYQNDVQTGTAATGSSVEVRGAGFGANKTIYVGLQGYFGLTPVTTDGAGSFSIAQVAPYLPGTYTYIAMAYRHNAWQVAASTTLTVW